MTRIPKDLKDPTVGAAIDEGSPGDFDRRDLWHEARIISLHDKPSDSWACIITVSGPKEQSWEYQTPFFKTLEEAGSRAWSEYVLAIDKDQITPNLTVIDD